MQQEQILQQEHPMTNVHIKVCNADKLITAVYVRARLCIVFSQHEWACT